MQKLILESRFRATEELQKCDPADVLKSMDAALFGGEACLLDPLSNKPLDERSETTCLSGSSSSTGICDLSPATATVAVNQPLTYAFTWTVPHPLNWHALTTLQFRIRIRNNLLLWVRFDKADPFRLYNQWSRTFGSPAIAGVFECPRSEILGVRD